MGWEQGKYYTRSKKMNGHVTREYVGVGAVGHLAARRDAATRLAREAKRAGIVAEREGIGAWARGGRRSGWPRGGAGWAGRTHAAWDGCSLAAAAFAATPCTTGKAGQAGRSSRHRPSSFSGGLATRTDATYPRLRRWRQSGN